jgi:hypothetical protein
MKSNLFRPQHFSCVMRAPLNRAEARSRSLWWIPVAQKSSPMDFAEVAVAQRSSHA